MSTDGINLEKKQIHMEKAERAETHLAWNNWKKIGYAIVRFNQKKFHSSSSINVIGFRITSAETHV